MSVDDDAYDDSVKTDGGGEDDDDEHADEGASILRSDKGSGRAEDADADAAEHI